MFLFAQNFTRLWSHGACWLWPSIVSLRLSFKYFSLFATFTSLFEPWLQRVLIKTVMRPEIGPCTVFNRLKTTLRWCCPQPCIPPNHKRFDGYCIEVDSTFAPLLFQTVCSFCRLAFECILDCHNSCIWFSFKFSPIMCFTCSLHSWPNWNYLSFHFCLIVYLLSSSYISRFLSSLKIILCNYLFCSSSGK